MPAISGSLPLPQTGLANATVPTASRPAGAANSSTSSATAAPAASGQLDTGVLLQLVQTMIGLLGSVMGGNGASAGNAGVPPAAPGGVRLASTVPTGVGCPSCGQAVCPGCSTVPGAAQVTGPGITTPMPGASQAPQASVARLNGVNNPQLQQSLNLIATDPEGQRLLAEAQRRGVSISVDNTGDPNVLGSFNPRTNQIIIGNPNNLKTIVHELVHSVTPEDGNSQTEEGLANVVGRRIEARLFGRQPENPQVTFNNTLPNYTQLRPTNDILNSLNRLGITA